MDNVQPVVIRPSRDADVDAMLAIYRRHIRRGIEEGGDDNGTPEPDDLRGRRKNLRNQRFPHLVATIGSEVGAQPPSDEEQCLSVVHGRVQLAAAARDREWPPGPRL